jgi:hypothetical protein
MLLPAAMALLAVLPLPYGYYTMLRLVVTIASLTSAVWFYRRAGRSWLIVALVTVALLFNPIVPVFLDRGIWLVVDVVVAAFLTFVAIRAWRQPTE